MVEDGASSVKVQLKLMGRRARSYQPGYSVRPASPSEYKQDG